MSSPLHLPNISGGARESRDYNYNSSTGAASGAGDNNPANLGPFLIGKKIVMVSKTSDSSSAGGSGSPSSGKSSPRSQNPTKTLMRIKARSPCSTASATAGGSGSESGSGSGSKSKTGERPKSSSTYDSSKISPDNRLQQCASPLKVRNQKEKAYASSTTGLTLFGTPAADEDEMSTGANPNPNTNPSMWERSHSLGGSPGHSVSLLAPPLAQSPKAGAGGRSTSNAAAAALSGALGAAATSRGNPINILTRTSVNSQRKSKIPSPGVSASSAPSLRKSLDSASARSSGGTSTSTGSSSSNAQSPNNNNYANSNNKALLSATSPASLSLMESSASAGSPSSRSSAPVGAGISSGTGTATATTSASAVKPLNLGGILGAASNPNTTTTTTGTGITTGSSSNIKLKLRQRGDSDSDLSDTNSNTDSASVKSVNSNSSAGSSNSAMVKSLVKPAGATSNASATSFQNACKARVTQQKKALQMALRNSVDSAHAHNSSRDMHAAIKETTAITELEKKKRNRAEVYAINAFLKNMEIERFTIFLKEQKEKESAEGGEGGLDNDDISWCTADSSLMPTPRYRSEKERNYTRSPSKSAAAGGV